LSGGITQLVGKIYGKAMSKRKEDEPQEKPYFTNDTSLFTGNFAYFRHELVLVRGKLHLAEEAYSKTDTDLEIIPLTEKRGMSTYINLKAYVLVPDIVVTIGLYPKPKQYADQEPAIGEVIATDEKPKMKEQEIGDGQAWYYPGDKTIVLWECELRPHFEDKPIHQDPNMQGLWIGFETFLTQHFKSATQIATTYTDPDYKTGEYQQFLTQLGYKPHPTARAAWAKKIHR
jgi:hypothetical protein